MSAEELKQLTHWVALRPNNEKAPEALVYYRLWKNDKANEQQPGAVLDPKKKTEPYNAQVPEGTYLVDKDGRVTHEDKEKKVSMKFKAPKTQVMGIIINGLLQNNLNWALVLIGAFIAIMLELCGISSLAFAVGVYIPMQYSTPIFLGGLVRWFVDGHSARRARKEARKAPATRRVGRKPRCAQLRAMNPARVFCWLPVLSPAAVSAAC